MKKPALTGYDFTVQIVTSNLNTNTYDQMPKDTLFKTIFTIYTIVTETKWACPFLSLIQALVM